MKKRLVDFWLYRWRYILGYGALSLLFVLSVAAASIYAPGGISQAEIDSLNLTNSLNFSNLAVIDLPFHLLQYASLSLFGVSIFAIKLPSIILSIIAATAMFFLLRRWFKPNVAILSMLIMAVTGQFIFVAQNATPQISYITFTALILLFASLVFQKAKHQLLWKVALAASVGLSLFTPYFLYINLGLGLAALIHPHTRYHLLKVGRKAWLLAGLIFLIIIAPLIYLCVNSPELLASIVGYNSLQVDIVYNLKALLHTYFWVEPIVSSGQITPIMDFATLAIIILGILTLVRQRHTARSYMIVAWLILSLPLLIFKPNLTIAITIPLFILLAVGVETLLGEWYKLFPKNPYARGVGLIMLVGLIGVMVFGGIDRFIYGYRQMPEAAREFNTDITLVNQQLSARPVKTVLLVSPNEQPLYKALSMRSKIELIIITSEQDAIGNVITTRAARPKQPSKNWVLQKIITNSRFENGDRLYLYKVEPHRL